MGRATKRRPRDSQDAAFIAFAESVGRRVAFLRHKSGLTQEKAAEAAGLHLTAWAKVEGGTTNPTLQTLYCMAEALGVEVRQLLLPKNDEVEVKRGRPPKL